MPSEPASAPAKGQPASEAKLGVLLGFTAYALWGSFPLYFHLLKGTSPVEIVANRVIWSLLFLGGVNSVTRSWKGILQSARSMGNVGLLTLAAGFLAVNWGVYIYAVVTQQVVEGSLGYFINPLVSVGLGVMVLRERLRRHQWAAVCIAVLAVIVLSIGYGRLPWISIVLAVTFALYGLIKKQVGFPAVESLTIETAALAPIALAAMFWFAAAGKSALLTGDLRTVLLLLVLGPVTAIPLLAFGGAATRIPLSTLGLLQYITPTVQFLLGVFVLGETMSPIRWAGFFLVWVSLAVMTVGGLLQARTRLDDLEVIEPD